jgi:hypothetical protein
MPRRKTPQHTYVFVQYDVSIREAGSKYPTLLESNTAVPADHPIVAAHPDAFGPDPVKVWPRGWSPSVEQATAAPGEVRDNGRGI